MKLSPLAATAWIATGWFHGCRVTTYGHSRDEARRNWLSVAAELEPDLVGGAP